MTVAGLVCGLASIGVVTVAFVLGIESALPFVAAVLLAVAMVAFWIEADR